MFMILACKDLEFVGFSRFFDVLMVLKIHSSHCFHDSHDSHRFRFQV